MTARARTLRRPPSPVARRRRFRLAPLARAVGIALAAGGLLGQAHAQKVFGPAWFAAKGAAPGQTATPAAQPGGALLPQPGVPDRQSQAAREKLQTSIANLSQAAQAIAARQSAQTAARTAAQTAAGTVANGLAEGGLKVDTNSLTAGWIGAKGPTQSVADGRTTVRIEQTDSKAILNWETFNVGRQTTVQFAQQAGDAVLNRVNDPQARPSQIQGRIEAAGTVLIVNRNGIVFDGSSQVNTRNLAAAAVGMSDAQFHKGLYSDAQGAGVNQRHIPSFANDLSTTASGFSHGAAEGQVIVNAGAKLQTHAPASVTEGGGYVMLLGGQVHNAGEIVTPNGQAVLAAGDAFTVRKGMGTEQNATSTTRGNLVDTLRVADSAAGLVRNTGLVQAATGDITLTGHELRQAGVLQASTSVHTRGTVHLKAVGADASVTLEGGSTTAIVLDASATTALDVQRETLVKDSDKAEKGARLDQSLVQIDSAGSVDFQRSSLTLATSGQVFVDAAGTATVHDQARIDVSGYVGVKIAMDANNVLVNVQGFEQRDAPVNRDGDKLRNNDIWLDRRDLVLVPAGTNGAEGDRWYTAGGLLEVGGYLGITGHGIGEWSAQGGTVQFSGKSLVTQQGSSINLSGGTLDVQTGEIWQTWLKGADGQLYNASSAPGDLLYTGLYRGFESVHKRWGNSATEAFRNPLIAPEKRVENGYTVGRDGGRLVVATTQAELQGDIETATYQGERQLGAREQGLDGYRQAQTAVARNGELVIGRYTPVYDADTRDLRHTPQPVAEQIAIGLGLATPAAPEDGQPPLPTRIALDAGWLNGLELGALRAYATGSVAVDAALTVAPGGEIALHATQVDIHADLTARGGRIALGNIAERHVSASQGWALQPVTGTAPPPAGYEAATTVADGVTLDTRGIWNNLQQDATAIAGLPYANGGSIAVRSSGNLSIGKGALLDTSSGATLHADDRLAGGKGGDITLVADGYPLDGSAAGLLVLEGELRGHGAKGGGTLHLQTGDAVVIGGQTAGSDGTLQAGQASLVNLVTTEAFTIAAGAVLPVDYHFVRTRAAAGEVVGGVPQVTVTDPDSWIRLEASWTLPKPSSNAYYAVATADGRVLNVQGYDWSAPVTLAAGTVIRQINNPQGFPVNAVVPAGAVPGGIPIVPTAGVLQAGTVAATDTTYAAGSLIGAGGRLPQTVAVRAPLQLDAERFAQGFSRYEVAGGQGLALAEGADLRVAMPVLQADAQTARTISTGADPQSVLQPVLLPQFSEDPATGRLQQRAGADLVLTAGTARSVQQGTAAPLLVPDSARIEVDAGHRIGLHGNGQITVDGQLRAHGGHIELLGLGYSGSEAGNLQGHDGSYWIGERAVLDVSGIAHTALDGAGRRYGTVLDGGHIEIGGAYAPFATIADAIDNFIVVRPGARLDASGAAATLDLPGLGATPLASDGGVIHLASFNGLFLDGNLRAAAAGAGAAGGTLSVVLETPNYSVAAGPSDRVRVHREIQLVAQQGAPQLAADLKPGEADPALAYGRALLGADRITAGGFDNLALLSNGMLTLGDGLDLRLGQSLYLAARSTSLLEGSEEGARVRLAAPHVRLSSPSRLARDNYLMPYLTAPAWDDPGMVSVLDDTQLRIDAGLLELQNRPTFGAYGKSQLLANPEQLERKGFELLELRSQGDLRFLAQDFSDRTQLTTEGDLVLAASQIYPATGARAEVIAGRLRTPNEWGTPQTVYDPTRSLRIERVGEGAAPPVPYSAFGSLALLSANIDQGGVLRAPLGQLQLGVGLASGINEQEPTQLVLRPGSITSVSAAGLVMPYGGTVDGLTYNYAGADVFFRGLGGLMGEVKLAADTVDVQGGAKLDLSGGGELRGAGFLTGRGGSTDARLNPLVQMADGGFVLPGLATNPVYAIVPGVQQAAAPVAAEKGAGDPAIGRQITIGAGVPGLPAGTYTLLPSTYALVPGAFRVELNGLASQGAAFGTSTAMRNGSHTTAVRLGTAGTAIADVQTTQAIVTSGETLRQYSQYNETSYAQFGLDWAVRDGLPRPQLERDARQLNIQVSESLALAQGVADFTPAKDGRGGTVVLNAGRIEVLADGAAPTAGFDGISVQAGMLNGLGAASIAIGGAPSSTFSSTAYQSSPTAWHVSLGGGATDEIILREGAVLRAAQVLLTVSNREMGLIVEQGASIDLLGRGKAPWDSSEGFVLVPGSTGVLALSNGWLDIMPSSADESFGTRGAGYLHIGTCAPGASCSGETRLYAEGTITAATNKSFLLDDSVRYGARNLVLAMAAINVGSNDALAQAGAAGIVPDGLTLNQGVLDRLLRGDTSTGAPALENLVLNARDAVNFYGSVNLSTIDAATGKSSLAQLALGAPAIYGHGAAGDVARIQTDTLVWNGALTPAGSVIAGGAGTGSGQLVIDARQIEFGYGPKTQPNTVATHDRLALGFDTVQLNASERITANHKGSLSVYQSQGDWNEATKAYDRSGGHLQISTPLLTSHAGSVNTITAGGSISARAPTGSTSPLADNAMLSGALGAELALHAGTTLTLDTAVLLPSGKLTLSAQGDVTLAANAQLDVAGRKIDFFDVSQYSWGGEALLKSQSGDVQQLAGSKIDLSAKNNRAGRLTATAMDGTVALAGAIAGSSTGSYDAGGTLVPYAAGFVDLRGQQIADFAGLNTRLTEGGVTGGRSFQITQGDLVIGSEVKAREINVSVDNGSLTVTGKVDASGAQAGSIRLAANGGLRLADGAVLDASATQLRKDSYGQVIEAPNRAVIELDSGDGRLVLGSAAMNLAVAGAPASYGTVTLTAPRLGANDVDIDASGAVTITGAKSIAVNAFRRYDDAAAGTDASVDGRSYQVVDQTYLDGKHADSTAFMAAALANGSLMDGKLAGLRGYTEQFHLRPGVEIVSNAATNPDGNLHVDGDLDLSGHRYASVNPRNARTSTYGSGEAGALVLRAQGDLVLFGSITDGFDTSVLPPTADDAGWVLPAGRMPFGGDLIVPHGGVATLDAGTRFAVGRTLNYDLPVSGLTLPAGTQLPTAMPLGQTLDLPAGTVLGAAVRDAHGSVLHAAGSVLAEAVTLPAGTQLGAGFRLPQETQLAATLWPKGVALPVPMSLSAPLTLAKGAIVPSETDVLLPGGATLVNLRPLDADGNQGRNLAIAPMLAAGSQSWDMRLVAGADLAAADARLTRPGSTATLRLADTHFGMGALRESVYGFSADADPGFIDFMASMGIDVQPGQAFTPDFVQMLWDYGILWSGVTDLNEYGYGTVLAELSATISPAPARQQLYSVLRTGTGDLDLVSGGDFTMQSLYGIYTAGTASASLGAAYDLARGRLADGSVLQTEGSPYEHLVDGGAASLYHAWYPEQGGNVLLRAGGDIRGDLVGDNGGVRDQNYTFANSRQQIGTASVGSWLWRQGTGSVAEGADAVPTAWWINFGSYVAPAQRDPYGSFLFGNDAHLVGFTGIGTLGGGNLQVQAGGDAGIIDPRGLMAVANGSGHTPRSQGLHLAVASTGRVTPAGEIVQTGGGDLELRLGGALNPEPALSLNTHDLNSTFVNLRGALQLQAGAIGSVQLAYGAVGQMDSRPGNPFQAGRAASKGGPILVLGDAGVRIETRGDLVLGGVADPGRTLLPNSSPFSHEGQDYAGRGWTWFSLWTPATAIDLLSAGGHLTPTTAWEEGGGSENTRWQAEGRNQSANGDGYFYPSILRAAAANGSLFYGASTSSASIPISGPVRYGFGVTLAPSPLGTQFTHATGKGELQLLAGGSIHASGFAITASTADPAGLSSVLRPGFVGVLADSGGGQFGFNPLVVHNAAAETTRDNDWIRSNYNGDTVNTGGRDNTAPLFTFGTPATSDHAVPGRAPARYYAATGDIVGLRLGQELKAATNEPDRPMRYEGSVPVAVRAGRDITDSGTRLGQQDTMAGRRHSLSDTRGNLIAHSFADDVSVVEAGRDVRNSSFYIVGPGLLDISAGRDVYLGNNGEFKSLGPVVNVTPGDRSSGAGISVAAGMGPGARWEDFAKRYLDPANQADQELPFADQPGKALHVYSGQLTLAQWLQQQFGYAGDEAGAQDFLAAKQTELDAFRLAEVAAGRRAANRALAREYKLENQLYLANWLTQRFGEANGLGLAFDAATMDAREFFTALPAEQQRVFLRNVYYNELRAAGREYTDADGKRFGSYLRGREAIATLFPEQDAEGHKIAYGGDLTMFSSALYYNADIVSNPTPTPRPRAGAKYMTEAEWIAAGRPMYNASYYAVIDAGIHTNFGGDISIMTPGGRTLVGIDGGFNPGPGSGVMTQGEGDISIYAAGDILMGQSRIFTTFGGNILGWSAAGDINAGRGSKTTVVYTPARRVYDDMGNVALSPSAPTTGAGIATLNPIAEIPPGDIDLIAPLGTIDAGEAGIRVSGNVNLAAMQVLNAENIDVQGEAVGIPVVAAVNVAALTNASAAASQASVAAQEVVQRERAAARQALPSVFQVRVIGFGDQPAGGAAAPAGRAAPGAVSYDRSSPLQLVAVGASVDAGQARHLTAAQRAQLQRGE